MHLKAIWRMFQVVALVPYIIAIGSQPAFASDELLRENLDKIEDFAIKYCGKYWYKSERFEEHTAAKAEGELKGFLDDLLGANIYFETEKIVSKYTGPTRDRLVEANELGVKIYN